MKNKAQKRPATFRGLSAFLLGMASVLDIGGTLYQSQVKPPVDDASAMRADAQALAGDWIAVGNDIRAAIGRYSEMHGQQAGA